MSRSTMDAGPDTPPAPEDDTDAAEVMADAATPSVRRVETRPGWRDRVRGIDRRLVAALVAIVLLAAGVLTWWLVQRDDLPEGAAFRLGDTTVTADQVDRRVEALGALYGVEVPEGAEEKSDFLRDAAKSMAVQLMLEDEADRRGIAVAAREIDDTLQGVIDQRYPDGGRTAFVAALGELGATEAQVRDEIGDQLLVSKLFDDVAGDVEVGDAALRDVFAERKAQLATPVTRTLRNIVVADRGTARQLLGRLRAGAPFAAVARTNSLDSSTRSSGGSLGAVTRADLEKAYGDAAFGAEVGALFGPVKTESGWNVGLVEKEMPARPAQYATVRDALRRTVLAEKSLQEWRSWLKDVIADHEVTYADAFRPDDPGAVPDIDQADVTKGE
jgi:peptidyl-prolyl cis-trans isomerase C